MLSYSINLCTLRLELKLSQGATWPTWSANQPHTIINTREDGYNRFVTVDINIIASPVIISNTGKTDQDTIIKDGQIIRDQSLTIQRMWANGVLLENEQISKFAKFYPVYQKNNIDYAQDHNITLPLEIHQLDFYYNGNWIFEFEQPFFTWYNQQLMDSLTNVNGHVKRSHLGIGDPDKIMQLKNILTQLND
jgi:hypothetical protein